MSIYIYIYEYTYKYTIYMNIPYTYRPSYIKYILFGKVLPPQAFWRTDCQSTIKGSHFWVKY